MSPNAKATLKTIILGDLIDRMPAEMYPHLERAAEIATEAIETPSIRWAIKEIATLDRED